MSRSSQYYFLRKLRRFHPNINHLGRYGDSLNPWGDIMAVAEAWCVTKPGAKLAIGFPTTLHDTGVLGFNSHRTYGKKNYPYLVSKMVLFLIFLFYL